MAAKLRVPPSAQRAAHAFERDGYAQISDLVVGPLLARIAKVGAEKMARAHEHVAHQTVTHKRFWVRLLDEDMTEGALPTDNDFVQFAMQPSVLELMSAIFGEVPLLVDVLLTLSHEGDEKLSYSQLWHRDHDDPRTVKLFVYLTDVNVVEDGPFTFIPKPLSDQFGFSLRSHLSDEKVFKRIPRSAVRAMIAPKLTAFIVETSRCLHMGSRMGAGRSRLLYTATYVTVPRVYPVGGNRFRVTTALSPEQKLLVNA